MKRDSISNLWVNLITQAYNLKYKRERKRKGSKAEMQTCKLQYKLLFSQSSAQINLVFNES